METGKQKKTDQKFTQEQLNKITEYQKIHTRLKILKFQMADIQDETHDLLETLNKMREIENKNKDKDNG